MIFKRFFSHRFVSYRQLESSDCGLTCVRMIARHYGKKIPLKALRQLAETTKLGVSLKDFTDSFNSIGMVNAVLRITENDMRKLPFPAIVYWRQRHFVVLYHYDSKKDRYYVADPSGGKIRFESEEFMRYWKGDSDKGLVVIAEPGEKFDQLSFPKPTIFKGLFRTVATEIRKHRKAFLYIILLSLFCMGADLAAPLLLQSTVDQGIALRDIGLVWMLIGGQLAIYLGNTVSSNVVQYLMMKLGLQVNLDMTRRYLKRLISFPLSFFDRKASSDLIQKLDDQTRLKNLLLQIPSSSLLIILNLLVFSGLLIWYNKWLFVFFICVTALEIGWTLIFLGRRRNLDYETFTRSSENRNNIYELINGMTEIKTSGAQHSRLSNWEKIQNRLIELSKKSWFLSTAMGGGQGLLARIKEISITGICATLVIKGNLTFGEMLTVGYIVGRLSGPFQNIISMFGQIQDAKISYERLDEVLNDNPEPGGAKKFKKDSIEFKGVSFRYPGKGNPYVIKDMHLTLNPGSTTAIVGESGCGKSTLIKLMLGFYIPQKGTLSLSNIDIKDLDRDSWLEQCGVVMQSGYIFSDTIASNISLSSEDTDLDKVRKVIEIVGLSSFIESLPMGLNTRIGTTGVELSGGQKQRILIARALYKNPEILFLDEATSSLDAFNERRISEKIQELQKGKTLIIAAHRLSTVKNADRILFMEAGKIVEEGTHEELISRKGKYYELVSNQLELAE